MLSCSHERRRSVRVAQPAMLALALVLAACADFRPAFAQSYPEVLVNDDFRGEEHRLDPVAARLDDGSLLVFWIDNARGHTDILGRRLDSEYAPIDATPFRVNTEEGHFAHRRLEVSEPNGSIVAVTWQDDRTGDEAVWARLYSTEDGTAIGGELILSQEVNSDAVQPRIATASDGTSLGVWISGALRKDRVRAQLIDSKGHRIGANFSPVPEMDDLNQWGVSADALPDGRWIVVWAQEDEGRDWNVYYRFLSSDGSPEGTITRINTDIFEVLNQFQPDVMVRENDILVIWTDSRDGGLDVWGRWIGHDGKPIDMDHPMREAPDPPADELPRAVRAEDGSFAIHWFGGIEDRQRAMIRYFQADKTPLGNSRTMSDPNSGILMRHGHVVPLGSGNWVELWSDNDNDDSHFDCLLNEVESSTPPPPEMEPKTIWSSPLSSSQVFADHAIFPDGRAIVAWSDLQYGSLAIFGRMLDPSGQPTGESFQISGVPANAQFDTVDGLEQMIDYSPSVAASADGFLVTWAINREGGRLNLYGQYYDQDGIRVGGNFEVAPDATDRPQWDPRPAMLNGGGFVIAFRMNTTDDGGDIFLQRYAPDGLPDGARISLVDSDARAAAQQSPSIAVSPSDEIMVAWIDQRGGGWDIWAQRLNSQGERVGENQIQHGADEPFNPQVSPTVGYGADRTITVWEHVPLTQGGIQGRLEVFPSLAANSQPEERYFRVNSGIERTGRKSPEVAMAPNGKFIVTWWDNNDGQTQLWAQRFDADADPVGGPYPVHGNDQDGSRLAPRVSVSNEVVHFVWSDSRRSKGWDIRSRKVDWTFSGEPSPIRLARWDANSRPGGLDLSWETGSEFGFSHFLVWRQLADEVPSELGHPNEDALEITSGGLESNEGGLYRYLDESAPGGIPVEYFLEAVDLNGDSEFFGPFSARREFVSLVALEAWPNPFQAALHMRLGSHGPFAVDIHDITGRRIRSLEGTASGERVIEWDGRTGEGEEAPAGVYFVRIRGMESSLKLLRIR